MRLFHFCAERIFTYVLLFDTAIKFIRKCAPVKDISK